MTDKTVRVYLVTDEMIDDAWVRQHQRPEINGVYPAIYRHDPLVKALADALDEIITYDGGADNVGEDIYVMGRAIDALAKYKEAVG